MPRTCSTPTTAPSSCPMSPDASTVRSWRLATSRMPFVPMTSKPASASSAAWSRAAARSSSTTLKAMRARVQIAGTGQEEEVERLMVAPLLAGQTVKGAMAVWRTGGTPVRGPRARVPGWAVVAGGGGDRKRAPVRRIAAARRRARYHQHGVAAARRQARAGRPARTGGGTDSKRVQGRSCLRGPARAHHRHDPLPVPVRRVRVPAAETRRRAHQQDH